MVTPYANALSLIFISLFPFCVLVQGSREGERAEQHNAGIDKHNPVHGPGLPFDVAPQAEAAGARESGRARGLGAGRQHGRVRVPAPVPEPTLELFDAQLSARQESLRENRRSG